MSEVAWFAESSLLHSGRTRTHGTNCLVKLPMVWFMLLGCIASRSGRHEAIRIPLALWCQVHVLAVHMEEMSLEGHPLAPLVPRTLVAGGTEAR
jgi:hypothetical protein